jgi:4-hydroxyphenylpyruvate dioxygenase
MSKFDKPAQKPNTGGNYQGFDHLLLYVGNAKQAADWYVARFGFTRVAFANLVTGSRAVATHVVRQNKVRRQSTPICFC